MSILLSILAPICATLVCFEIKAWWPKLLNACLRAAVNLAPREHRDRLSEEWAAHLADAPGAIAKIFAVLGFLRAGRRLPSTDRRLMSLPTRVGWRVLDLGLATMFVLILAPTLLLVALAIRLTGHESALVIAKRFGRGGRTIDVYRFRTFSSIGGFHKTTRLGVFLRATSVDRLPQLVSVIRGDMSFVGPQPWSRLPKCPDCGGDMVPELKPGFIPLDDRVSLAGYVRSVARSFLIAIGFKP